MTYAVWLLDLARWEKGGPISWSDGRYLAIIIWRGGGPSTGGAAAASWCIDTEFPLLKNATGPCLQFVSVTILAKVLTTWAGGRRRVKFYT